VARLSGAKRQRVRPLNSIVEAVEKVILRIQLCATQKIGFSDSPTIDDHVLRKGQATPENRLFRPLMDFFYSLVRLLTPRPMLRLTESAKSALTKQMERIDDSPLVVCVGPVAGGIWHKQMPDGTVASESVSPGWGVGFYRRSNIPAADVVEIDGLEFARDERLDTKILDYANGRFVVIEGAI